MILVRVIKKIKAFKRFKNNKKKKGKCLKFIINMSMTQITYFYKINAHKRNNKICQKMC